MAAKIILISVTSILFFIYVLIAWWLNGSKVLKSISKSYYLIDLDRRWVFQLWIFSIGLMTAVVGNGLFFYISGFMLCLVGLFPTIKNEKHLIWHMVGAVGSIAVAFLGMYLETGSIVLHLIMIGSSISAYLLFRNNWIWYVEIVSFVLIQIYFISQIS